MAREAFLDRPRSRVATSAGGLELPVLYYDASALLAYFHVERRRAEELLAGTPLAPARFARGPAIAAVVAYDHRASSVGPYRELATALAVIPRGVAAPTLPLLHLLHERAHEDVGWYVLDLPVTSPLADAAGRELWGFPKFVTEIDLDVAHDEVLAAVQAPIGEEPILVLSGRLGLDVTLDAMDLVLYSVGRKELLRSLVEARGPMHTGFGGRLTLSAGRAVHPMADRLLSLGLDGARPFAVQVCREYRAVLHAGQPFGGVARAA
jgi:acetoacetate decarboxylase